MIHRVNGALVEMLSFHPRLPGTGRLLQTLGISGVPVTGYFGAGWPAGTVLLLYWIETVAADRRVHIRRHLERVYGQGRWRKMKGIATVELADATICEAEIHWYEAHGIGRKDFKIKRVLK